MDKILYYPYINLPRTDWSIRTLLYYESIGSIVPQEYFFNDDGKMYDPFMRDLVKNKLVIPINPMKVLDEPLKIFKPLLDFLENRYKGRKFSIHESEKIYESKFTRIHADKFDDNIFYQLEEMGLAKKSDGRWYYVERMTAEYLMKYLASVIGTKLEMLPTTDTFTPTFLTAKQSEKRETILRELIPFPEEINLKKLRKFKEKHHDLLLSFKNKVEQIVLDENLIEGTGLFSETVKDLEFRKDELSAKMNENQFEKIFFGTVCGIFGAYVGLLAGDTTGAFVGGMPGFANAIYSALQIERAEDVFDQSGLKYLALVDKRIRY